VPPDLAFGFLDLPTIAKATAVSDAIVDRRFDVAVGIPLWVSAAKDELMPAEVEPRMKYS
jgi:hypothetical protein